MLVARYFLYVGGALLALIFAIGSLVPQQTAVASNPSSSDFDKTTVRIHSQEKLPERVVFDTSISTIVPPASTVAAAPVAVPSEISAKSRVRDTFAQFASADGKPVAQPEVKKIDPQMAPKKRKVAKVHTNAPPMMLRYPYPQQSPVRVAQQSHFGFFSGGWRSVW